MNLLVENSPFSQVDSFSFTSNTVETQNNVEDKILTKEVTILYGSQTCNSQGVAEAARLKLEKLGFKVSISCMKEGDMNTEDTESYLSYMQQQNRYQFDVINKEGSFL